MTTFQKLSNLLKLNQKKITMKLIIFAIFALLVVHCNTIAQINHSQKDKKINTTKTLNNQPNILTDIKWKTNGICFTEDNHKKVILNAVDEKKSSIEGLLGHFAIFQQDGTFENYYSPECCNDCYVSLEGIYELVNDSEVKIHVQTITYSGYCKKKQVLKPNTTYEYSISKQGKNYTLDLK